jgi:aryl-alcohol dehydrogenase-like predicted oxidoreductase
MNDMALTRLDQYRLLGDSGLRVSPLCLGTMTFGKDWGWGADRKSSEKMFDVYAQAGGNFIDTANFYTFGESEKMLGDFLASEREHFVLATKYTINMKTGGGKPGRPDPNAGGNHRKNMMQSVEASLRRLKTDYIDLYWLHMWDYSTPVDELMRGLDDLVRSGKVLYLAISDTPAWKIAECNTYARCHALSRFVATQVEYSLVCRDAERDILPMCRELGLGFLPWSPLAGGILAGKYTRLDLDAQKNRSCQPPRFANEQRSLELTERKLQIADAVTEVSKEIGKTPAQVALNWALSQRGVTCLIIGARTIDQLNDNLGALDFILPEKIARCLDEVSAIAKGFPHNFIEWILSTDLITGGTEIVLRRPDV